MPMKLTAHNVKIYAHPIYSLPSGGLYGIGDIDDMMLQLPTARQVIAQRAHPVTLRCMMTGGEKVNV